MVNGGNMSSSDIYPQAPQDESGGYMLIQYTNGTDRHMHRVHVLPFSTTAFIVGGGTPSVSVDDGNHDYAYTPDRPAGQEAGITDTFAAYVGKLRGFYNSTWTFSLASLYQRGIDHVLREVFPLPNATPIVGNSPNGPAVGQARALELIYNMKTANGGRAKIILIGNQALGLDVPTRISATTGGAPTEQQLVAYVSSGATGIVGHDNQKIQPSANRTSVFNRRLRRHYGYA
jgi:hypothetical protein